MLSNQCGHVFRFYIKSLLKSFLENVFIEGSKNMPAFSNNYCGTVHYYGQVKQ